MFLYEKELARKLENKAHELIHLMEKKKDCILKELSGVDKITLTRLRALMDDYYNAENNMSALIMQFDEASAKTLADFKSAMNDLRKEIERGIRQYVESHTFTDYARQVIEDLLPGLVAGEILGAYSRKDDLREMMEVIDGSEGHCTKMFYEESSTVPIWKVSESGALYYTQTRQGSPIMKCPKNMCLSFVDINVRVYMYFYKKVGDSFELTWDFVDVTSGTATADGGREKNYITATTVPYNMVRDIPDDIYVQVVHDKGGKEGLTIYGWDGVHFGFPIAAGHSHPVSADGEADTWNNKAGDSSITIPGEAKILIIDNGYIRITRGYKDGASTIVSSRNSKFITLPEGYDYFRARYVREGYENPITFTGDVSDGISCLLDCTRERCHFTAKKIEENARKICAIEWTPKKNVMVNSKGAASNAYKAGVTYRGLPYGSQWETAHFVGWHVSPHTFVNAVNDEDSIFYNEVVSSGGIDAPYYGTVCSAFATMAAGWPCIQTNTGFMLSPDLYKNYSFVPEVGSVYTDVFSHCVIPTQIIRWGDKYAITAFEGIRPTCEMTTRFGEIPYGEALAYWDYIYGKDYYTDYGFNVYNPLAKGDLSNVPYADFDDVEIIESDVRPYKGDKCVVNLAIGEKVKLNIKNPDITHVYFKNMSNENVGIAEYPVAGGRGGVTGTIEFPANTAGIYEITSNVNSIPVYVEVVNPATIDCTITNGNISFSNTDFWYANVKMIGHPLLEGENEGMCMPSRADNNYSKYMHSGLKFVNVEAIYKKGTFGAYLVPFNVSKEGE